MYNTQTQMMISFVLFRDTVTSLKQQAKEREELNMTTDEEVI